MNIFDFMNLEDEVEALESIAWEPNSLEASRYVLRSKKHTLKEKISAWQELIATMPDMPISAKYPSLHSFLRTYIEKVQALTDAFMSSENNAVFAYSVYCDDEWIRDENLYSSYEGVLRAANDDNDLSPKLFSIRKRFLDCPNNTWYAYLSPKLEIMRIENSNSPMSDEDFEILYEVFEEIKNTLNKSEQANG